MCPYQSESQTQSPVSPSPRLPGESREHPGGTTWRRGVASYREAKRWKIPMSTTGGWVDMRLPHIETASSSASSLSISDFLVRSRPSGSNTALEFTLHEAL